MNFMMNLSKMPKVCLGFSDFFLFHVNINEIFLGWEPFWENCDERFTIYAHILLLINFSPTLT